jgi:hypothetical protein
LLYFSTFLFSDSWHRCWYRWQLLS